MCCNLQVIKHHYPAPNSVQQSKAAVFGKICQICNIGSVTLAGSVALLIRSKLTSCICLSLYLSFYLSLSELESSGGLKNMIKSVKPLSRCEKPLRGLKVLWCVGKASEGSDRPMMGLKGLWGVQKASDGSEKPLRSVKGPWGVFDKSLRRCERLKL